MQPPATHPDQFLMQDSETIVGIVVGVLFLAILVACCFKPCQVKLAVDGNTNTDMDFERDIPNKRVCLQLRR